MNICIIGGDGYLGWATALYLSARGHRILIIDSMIKRLWEKQCEVAPIMPVPPLRERVKSWAMVSGNVIKILVCDIVDNYELLETGLQAFAPEAVVHYGEQPSAPFSMMDRHRAIVTQRNNVIGTLNVVYAIRSACPGAHLVKLGTMGEYGTPNIDIEEGWLEITHNGRSDRVLYPKKLGSIYHLSKVHDSANLEFACRTWGMKVTDLNQGIVYGTGVNENSLDSSLNTSFHYDAIFGTVLNRFVVQAAVELPITIYGRGGQTRGFIHIRDTARCVELAIMSPPKNGEFRVFNQMTDCLSVYDLALMVQMAAQVFQLQVKIKNIKNPRVEEEEHYYNPKYAQLLNLGLEAHRLTSAGLESMIEMVIQNRERVDSKQIAPRVYWA
jgi:UDP-sulfoquinovose synthase